MTVEATVVGGGATVEGTVDFDLSYRYAERGLWDLESVDLLKGNIKI